MGLAASQARLLTVTSRLSNIEYKQQQIANMKMRMSVENEQIATDYSNALNNQTLEFTDDSLGAFTYDNLRNAGYGVMKTSDGSLATASGGSTVSTSTIPDEIMQWAGKSEPVLGQGDYTLINPTVVAQPVAPTLVKDTTGVSSASTTTNKVTMESLGMSSMQSTVQTLLNSSYVTQRGFSTTAASNAIDNAINNLTPYESKTGTYFSSAISSLNTAKANLSALTLTVSKSGTSNFQYAQNTVRELDTVNEVDGTTTGSRLKAPRSTVETREANDLTLDEGLTLTRNYKISNPSIVSTYTTQAMSYAQSGITMLNSSTSSSASASGNTSSSSINTLYQQQLAKYNQYIANLATDEATKTKWQTDHDNWQAYQNLSATEKQYGTYGGVNPNSTTPTTYNDLATQCRNNPQFLIQGLLSGYLTLTDADGNPTSLDSNTAISTVYDKSDDAKAEAEYESKMSKLNRKEKQLDNQMSQLDTEYSALTTEYESIKSIISTHAQKDFELFS